MRLKCKTRLCASATHFSASLLIFSAFIFVLLKLWYPAPFFSASGGWQGLKIVALVDLVLGPLLTFVIYNLNKPVYELRRDLGIIITFQLSALIWGIITIYQQRPVVVAFWEDRFYTVPAYAIENQGVNVSALDKYDTRQTKYVFIQKPQSEEAWKPVLDKIYNHNIAPHHQIELYRPIEKHFDDIYKHNLDVDEIISNNSEMGEKIQEILDDSGSNLQDNRYIGLESKYRNIILIFNPQNRLIGTASAPFKDRK